MFIPELLQMAIVLIDEAMTIGVLVSKRYAR